METVLAPAVAPRAFPGLQSLLMFLGAAEAFSTSETPADAPDPRSWEEEIETEPDCCGSKMGQHRKLWEDAVLVTSRQQGTEVLGKWK